MKHIIYALFLAVLASSCSGVKGLKEPNVKILPNYIGMTHADSTTIADVAWWEYYSDSTLVVILRKTLDNNYDILKAAATVEEMRQLYGIERLNLTPQINGIVGATHETTDYHGESFSRDPEFSLKGTVSWEVNLWGSLSWARKQSLANYRASEEDLRGVRMTLIAEAASNYFNLLALDNELAIVRRTLSTRQEALEQARIRFEGGLTSETVYQQAQVEYATTASLIPDLERRITICCNKLTMLMGDLPREVHRQDGFPLYLTLPDSLPIGLPSGLLKRRPDVRGAELRLQAAMADVGLKYADRFPNLRLAVTGGWENDEVAHWLQSPYSYLVGNIAGSIFDFGKKKRKYKAAIAAYDRARYAYEQSVIVAMTEVENALITLSKKHEATLLQNQLSDAAAKYVKLAALQYRAGSLNYLDVLDAQRRFFDAQIGVNNALRDQYLALINLYLVLGGGWQLSSE
ncbi:MAG: TolC family protein [Muribaculaceae bacterium]|nr:TolC family protein [Muribaculaceae bacterium]MDE6322378.1 TolC family protein [Muribaculaceae bacterium]